MKPFIPWIGSKYKYGSLFPVPTNYKRYIEPFVGGGGFLFYLQPSTFIINDINFDLYNLYIQIRDHPMEVMSNLDLIPRTRTQFLYLGNQFNNLSSNYLCKIHQAVAYLYLNKLSFNSHMNFRKNKDYILSFSKENCNNTLYNTDNILQCSHYLHKGKILNQDYKDIIKLCRKDDFIFLDPPYVTSSYKIYNDDWNLKDDNHHRHDELFNLVKKLHQKGCWILLTYNYSPKIIKRYKKELGFKTKEYKKKLTLLPKRNTGEYKEVFLYNY